MDAEERWGEDTRGGSNAEEGRGRIPGGLRNPQFVTVDTEFGLMLWACNQVCSE